MAREGPDSRFPIIYMEANGTKLSSSGTCRRQDNGFPVPWTERIRHLLDNIMGLIP